MTLAPTIGDIRRQLEVTKKPERKKEKPLLEKSSFASVLCCVSKNDNDSY